MSDIFDFGFTAVDEDELDAVKVATTQAKGVDKDLKATQDKIDNVFNAIMPLLNKLKKNPEKEYILWPDRLDKVEKFEDHLQKIYQS